MNIPVRTFLVQDKFKLLFCAVCRNPISESATRCQSHHCKGNKTGEVIERAFHLDGSEALQLERLNTALGAASPPAGTAPRKALEDIWQFCAEGGEVPFNAISALLKWSDSHQGDWGTYNNPPKLPDPDSDQYASGLGLLDTLRRLKRMAANVPAS